MHQKTPSLQVRIQPRNEDENQDGMKAEGKTQEPDFTTVYSFLGTLFDLAISDETKLRQLCAMTAIEQHVILILGQNLMKNLGAMTLDTDSGI